MNHPFLSASSRISSIAVVFFRSTVISTMIKRIVDYDTDNINSMSTIIASECSERVVQQREPNGCEKLWFDRDKNVARGVICCLGEYRFGRGAVYQDEILVLELIGDKARQNPRVRSDCTNQIVGKIES